ncbi:MAG TPA: redoxin domain-containing protein [Bacteroidota bacterium]|nr:redoxin domain-containing protein [Bacteroidota bacterium]
MHDLFLNRLDTSRVAEYKPASLRPAALLTLVAMCLALVLWGVRWAVAPAEAIGNEPLPTLLLSTIEGSVFTLKPGTGKPMALLLFTVECIHCRNEARNFSTLYDSFNPNIMMMGLSVSGVEQTRQFAREGSCRFPIFHLEGSEPVGWGKRMIVPALFLVDGEGKVKGTYLGERSIGGDRNIISAFIGRLEAQEGFPDHEDE